MKENSKNYRKKELKIHAIETTSERLTGRGRDGTVRCLSASNWNSYSD